MGGLAASVGGISVCTFGSAPLPLNMPPKHQVEGPNGPFCNINDILPGASIPNYIVCKQPSVPKPCSPSISAPWCPPVTTVLIDGAPAFDNTAQASCARMGNISIVIPTQPSVFVG